jgi:hypothetical protein
MLFMDGPRRISGFHEFPDFLHVRHEGSAAIAIPASTQSCDLAHFSLLSAAVMRRAAFYDIPRHCAALDFQRRDIHRHLTAFPGTRQGWTTWNGIPRH